MGHAQDEQQSALLFKTPFAVWAMQAVAVMNEFGARGIPLIAQRPSRLTAALG